MVGPLSVVLRRQTSVERLDRVFTYVEASAALIERVGRDRAALAELYDLYVRRVYAFCLSRAGNEDEAEDLTAQTFERALHAIGRYEDRGRPLSSWLLTIAARLLLYGARERARFAEGDVEIGDMWAHDPTPEAQVEEWERDGEIRSLISTLPNDQQRAIRLR